MEDIGATSRTAPAISSTGGNDNENSTSSSSTGSVAIIVKERTKPNFDNLKSTKITYFLRRSAERKENKRKRGNQPKETELTLIIQKSQQKNNKLT